MSLIRRVEVTVLVEDSTNMDKPDVLAKHGLSLFIQAETSEGELFLMMDTGPSPDVLNHNSKVMNIDLTKTMAIIISHGHYDHIGGLVGALKHMERGVPVIVHPQAFSPKFKVDPVIKYIGSPFNSADVEKLGGKLILSRNHVKIAGKVFSSGEIKRNMPVEEENDFWAVEKEIFIKDPLMDDQALFLNVKGKGLIVISGCAHSGIINTIKQAKEVMKENKVYAVLGGFHLIKASDERIQATINELLKVKPEFIAPCHCTGDKTINLLKEVFGDHCQRLRTGSTLKL